ncbi:MAG: hypothetical protein M1838_004408, partial [Thelocarpon superellum]
MWIRIFETWLTARLLASPAFHRVVRGLHRRIHEIRQGHGVAGEGGAKIEKTGPSDTQLFVRYFLEELRDQIRGGPPKS